MAIALGQPVEEITHGLEGIKIDAQVRIPDKAGKPEVQAAPGSSPTDVINVQARHVGHEHPGGEMALRMQASEASTLEQGNLVSGVIANPTVENQGIDQGHPSIEPTTYATEPFPQHHYSGVPQIPFQGPIFTGYPAPVMNFHGYCYPYPVDGIVYQSPVVDSTHVYNQNYFYSAPDAAAPYNIGYSTPYGYPQYQVAPVEHYSVTAASPPLNQEGVILSEVQLQDPAAFMPYNYHPMSTTVGHGQWVPMAMVGPPLPGESVPGFNVVPFPQTIPAPVSMQPTAWIPQPEGPKGPSDGDDLKLGLQHIDVQSDSGHDTVQNDFGANLQRVESKASVVDNKKHVKKHFGIFYGSAMPLKGSWVRSGHLNCVNSAYPTKVSSNTKSKNPGMRIPNPEPLSKTGVNSMNFSTDFEDAKHFIIKSFSEENVYRSIQYGVWASTPNGNKKLDEAFKDAQSRAIGKAKGCPVFLYFSVNGSGRFCGVAEMVGPVDYNNTMDFWERNRWCGSFPVKWHFIKDVPHCQLRRIILQNNENKPVTSSRDTQEVNFEQGLQMLNIIKNYSTKASILDNFPGPPKAVMDAKLESPSAERLDESNVAAFNEKELHQVSPATMVDNNNALRASNGEAKARDIHAQAKLKMDATSQGGSVVEGVKKVEKENVMVSSVSSTVAA